MAEENKHMDDAFQRMAEGFKVSYDPSFWKEAEAKLDDAFLDDAFRAAAANVVVSPAFEPTEGVDDMFMDSAFVEAAAGQSATYDPSYFEQFMQQEGDLVMDEAFTTAASATVVDYLPEYWNDADVALQNEGLHYEYSSEYWADAKRLLDKSDRNAFFFRWSAIAGLLMLLSFGAQQALLTDTTNVDNMQAHMIAEDEFGFDQTDVQNPIVSESRENLLADKAFNADYAINVAVNANNAQGFQGNENDGNHVNIALNGLNQNGSNGNEGNTGSEGVSTPGLQDVVGNTPRIITGNLSNTILNAQDLGAIDLANSYSELAKNNHQPTLVKENRVLSPTVNQIGYTRLIPEIKIEKPQPSTMHTVGVIAQGGIGNRWGEFSFMPTLRSGIGVEYVMSSGKYLRNFEFGGNFIVNHIRQSQLSAEDRRETFDAHSVTKISRTVYLNDMIYANLNAFANYRIAPVHKLKFGVGVDYLIGLRSNMSYIESSSNVTNADMFSTEITTVNNNWGVKEGINKFDIRMSLGYEYEVSDRLGIQVNSYFGMFDRTDNEFLHNEQRDKEISVMLGLKYNFMKKMK